MISFLLGFLQNLAETALGLLAAAAVLRFMLNAFHAPWKNPVGLAVYQLTEFAVSRMRFNFTLRGHDLKPLLWAWIVQSFASLIRRCFEEPDHLNQIHTWLLWSLGMAVVSLLRFFLYLLMGAVFMLAALSWLHPQSNLMPVADALSHPFLQPMRRFIPQIGGVDLSPVILLIIYELTLTTLLGGAEMVVQRFL
jgi:YggT family protein